MTGFEQEFKRGQHTMDTLQAELARSVYLTEPHLHVIVGSVCLEKSVLLEADPGLGKTTIAKATAAAMGGEFGRHQGTNDKLPSDITGSEIYNPATRGFDFRRGPVFSNVLLADELNRNQPKTQGALLEAMEEKQVTVGGVTYPLPRPFVVLASQNPVETAEGTSRLTVANVDRFPVGIKIPSLTADERKTIRGFMRSGYQTQQVVSPEDILATVAAIDAMPETTEAQDHVNRIIDGVRDSGKVDLPDSVLSGERAFSGIMDIAKSQAMLQGTQNVAPQHLESAARFVLPHRMAMTFEAEMDGLSAEDLVSEVLEALPKPQKV